MPMFTPANTLETKLAAVLSDKHTPLWSFYTPLAAAPLWIITKHYPELDGSDEVAPDGGNPAVCVMQVKDYSYIGLYTSESRVREIFEQWKISRTEYTCVSARGYQLLRYCMTFDDVDYLWINAGLEDCQYQLDTDMVEILLKRPEPIYEPEELLNAVRPPTENLHPYLKPLCEFLAKQPAVRAAWIFERKQSPAPDSSAKAPTHEIGLVMRDPSDESLLAQVSVMARALSPVEMEWGTMLLKADDGNFRKLRRDHPAFYEAPDFLKKKTGGAIAG